jgi:hypothetical protein
LLPSPKHTELLKYGVYLKRIQDYDRALLMLTSAKERNSLSPDSFEEMAVGSNQNREENCLAAVKLDEVGRCSELRFSCFFFLLFIFLALIFLFHLLS